MRPLLVLLLAAAVAPAALAVGAPAPPEFPVPRSQWNAKMCLYFNGPGPFPPEAPKELIEWCYAQGYATPWNSAAAHAHPAGRRLLALGTPPIFPPLDPSNTVLTRLGAGFDDVCWGPFAFPSPLVLGGNSFPNFHASSNGLVPLQYCTSSYVPSGGFQGYEQAVITAFWADMDSRGNCFATSGNSDCNTLAFRVSTASSGLPADLDTAQTYFGLASAPEYVVVVSWFLYGYFSSGVDKLNTVQVVIAKHSSGTSLGLFYPQIEWNAGNTNGGSGGIWQPSSGRLAAIGGYTTGPSGGGVFWDVPGSGGAGVLQWNTIMAGTDTAALQPGQVLLGNIDKPGCPGTYKLCPATGRCIRPDYCCHPKDCPPRQGCIGEGNPCVPACDGYPVGLKVLNGRWLPSSCGPFSCEAVCNAGYTSKPAPTLGCDTTKSPPVWMTNASDYCHPTCTNYPSSVPPAATALSGPNFWTEYGHTWDPACTNVSFGGVCTVANYYSIFYGSSSYPGACAWYFGWYGRPQLKCNGGAWATKPTADCLNGGGCAFKPDVVLPNTIWPDSCAGSGLGATCTATCQAGYGNSPDKMASVTCELDPNGNYIAGSWMGKWGNVTGQACKPVCTRPPPATTGVTWQPICSQSGIYIGGYCVGACASGARATSLCTSGGWTRVNAPQNCATAPVVP